MTAEASEPEKQLIQYFLNKPLLTGLELQKVCSTIFGKNNMVMDDIKKIIKKLNELLKPCQLGIKFRLCEDSNEEHFVLLNLNETIAAVKHTSEFTVPEFDLLKLILEEIITSDSGMVSSIVCINFSTAVVKLSKSDAQRAMEKFISSQWLKEKEGEVSLTVRTLLEMEPYLKKLDDDLMDCKICGCLVVKGIVCPNESCASKVHRFCLSRLSRATSSASSQIKCPKCQRIWANLDETLLMPSNNNNGSGGSSSSQQPNGRSQRATQSSQRREQSQSQPQPGTSNGTEGTSGGRRRTRQISSSESD